MADVVANVEALIGHPVRPGQASRPSARQALQVARNLAQPRGQLLPYGLDRRSNSTRRGLEHHHAAEVHQRALVELLKPEKRPVERRQRVCHVLKLRSGAVAVIGAEQRSTSVVPPVGDLVRRPLLRRRACSSADGRQDDSMLVSAACCFGELVALAVGVPPSPVRDPCAGPADQDERGHHQDPPHDQKGDRTERDADDEQRRNRQHDRQD